MPEPTEIIQPAGQHTEPIIPEAVAKAGLKPVNEAKDLSDIHAQLADLQVQSVGGPDTVPTTNHEATTATVTPINMPAPDVPTDTKTTHWWNNMFQTKHTEQQGEKEELPNAA